MLVPFLIVLTLITSVEASVEVIELKLLDEQGKATVTPKVYKESRGISGRDGIIYYLAEEFSFKSTLIDFTAPKNTHIILTPDELRLKKVNLITSGEIRLKSSVVTPCLNRDSTIEFTNSHLSHVSCNTTPFKQITEVSHLYIRGAFEIYPDGSVKKTDDGFSRGSFAILADGQKISLNDDSDIDVWPNGAVKTWQGDGGTREFIANNGTMINFDTPYLSYCEVRFDEHGYATNGCVPTTLEEHPKGKYYFDHYNNGSLYGTISINANGQDYLTYEGHTVIWKHDIRVRQQKAFQKYCDYLGPMPNGIRTEWNQVGHTTFKYYETVGAFQLAGDMDPLKKYYNLDTNQIVTADSILPYLYVRKVKAINCPVIKDL